MGFDGGDDASCVRFPAVLHQMARYGVQVCEICMGFLGIRVDSEESGGGEIDRGEARRN